MMLLPAVGATRCARHFRLAHVADMPKSDSDRHALMPLSSRFGHLLRPRPNRAVARHSALVNPDPVAQAPSARRGLLVDVAPSRREHPHTRGAVPATVRIPQLGQ